MLRITAILFTFSLLFSPFAVFAEEELAPTIPAVASTPVLDIATTTETPEATTPALEVASVPETTSSTTTPEITTTTETIEATSIPILELATTAEITESTSTPNATEATTTEISFPVYIPMYIFGNSGGGVLGITPISEDAFVWLYVANSEKAEISSTTAATSSFENTSSTSSENFQWTPLGLLVLSWDV